MRHALKASARGLSLLIAFPFALLSLFGRIPPTFSLLSQSLSLLPGLPGSYLRAAYYHLTLQNAHHDIRIDFGSFFAHKDVILEERVSIGPYCVIGKTAIGARSLLAAHVQILSGSKQHYRSPDGKLQHGTFTQIKIGCDAWIGAGALILADVGDRCTIAAGAVVVHPVPSDSIVGGNPARALKSTAPADPLAPPL